MSLVAISFACSKTSGNNDPNSSKITIEANSTNLNEISKLIFEKYLDEFKKNNVLKEKKLKDYKIGKISDIKGNVTEFDFFIFFSVEPYSTNSFWNAGTGTGNGSWINDKQLHVVVKKVDNKYTIKSVGSGI